MQIRCLGDFAQRQASRPGSLEAVPPIRSGAVQRIFSPRDLGLSTLHVREHFLSCLVRHAKGALFAAHETADMRPRCDHDLAERLGIDRTGTEQQIEKSRSVWLCT